MAGRHRRRASLWRSRSALFIAAAALPTTVLVATAGPATSAAAVDSRDVTITSFDGTKLAAHITRPDDAGTPRLLIVPGAWGEKPMTSPTMAQLGFEMVSYAQRGFGGSGGAVDFNGPSTVGDFESVLRWAINDTAVKKTHISVLGTSYGAVTALMGAEFDARVSAVVAISPWGDLSDLVAPGGDLNGPVLSTLLSRQRLDAQLTTLHTDLTKNPAAAVRLGRSLAQTHSVLPEVGELNARQVPVLLAGSLEDSIAPASDLRALFGALTGPKRLVAVQGDHGATDSASAFAPTGPWWGAAYWLLKYGLDLDVTPAQLGPTVSLTDQTTGSQVTGDGWPDLPGEQLDLTSSGAAVVPPLGAAPATVTGWRESLADGAASAADSAAPSLTSTLPYTAPTISMTALQGGTALTWAAAPVDADLSLCGAPSVDLDLSATTSSTALYTYLYDVSPSGSATLLSATPREFTGMSSTATPELIALEPACATIPAGDHIALVMDTADARYPDAPTTGTLTVSAPTDQAATLRL